ncbi:hypothetical protein ACTGJ9_006150 [Bradyrhizobium sp. RDM12]
MAAGLVSSPLDMSDIATLIDQREGPGKKRGLYKKKATYGGMKSLTLPAVAGQK